MTTEFSIVLVESSDSLNIGSVMRVMWNMGFDDLRLVSPKSYDPKLVEKTARGGVVLMDSVQTYDTLESAISELTEVVGFSAREGRDRREQIFVGDWVARLGDEGPGKVGLVFGSEEDGLRREQLCLCHTVVTIPTIEDRTSLNLAQAVMIACYEIRRAEKDGLRQLSERTYATSAELHQLDELVESTLVESGFYRKGSSAAVPFLIKNLFRRIRPDKRELGILMAMFNKISGRLAS